MQYEIVAPLCVVQFRRDVVPICGRIDLNLMD
jgi:hypothetical protein